MNISGFSQMSRHVAVNDPTLVALIGGRFFGFNSCGLWLSSAFVFRTFKIFTRGWTNNELAVQTSLTKTNSMFQRFIKLLQLIYPRVYKLYSSNSCF